MMTLTPKLRQEIVDFFTNIPSLHSENGRRAMLLSAGLDHVLPLIELSGSTTKFASLLVEHLAQYGTRPGQQPALILLLQGVSTQVGLEKQEFIQILCERLTVQRAVLLENCPYRGLFVFREKDEPFFFGRETYTRKLVEAVQEKPLVVVIGASGSGKSSVVYAGLFPKLQHQGKWIITSFRPGNNPFQALAKSLISFLYTDELERLSQTKKLATQLQSSEISLPDVFTRITEKDEHTTKFLLFVDQFEELYTLCRNDLERRRFLDELLRTFKISKTLKVSDHIEQNG